MPTKLKKLTGKNQYGVEETTWPEVRSQVAKINPDIAKIIDGLPSKENCPLLLAKYPYGADIHKSGLAYFPTSDGTLVSLDDPRLTIVPHQSKNQVWLYFSIPI